MSTTPPTKKIAIIGGGVSGLSTAYYLMQRAAQMAVHIDIHLFEQKPVLGGNADTVVVSLGHTVGGASPGAEYVRWADLGVNDANLATYARMKTVMADIGFLDHMLPLQDTACYHDADGHTELTDDASLQAGVSNPAFNLQQVDGGRLFALIRVVHQTALNMLESIDTDYTCARYFQDCLDEPQVMLQQAAAQLGISIDWVDPGLAARLLVVRDSYYYPRISAMYFTDPSGPATMPLQAPFEYYQLQEGGVKPDRCYFNHGAQTWLEALEKTLLQRSNAKQQFCVHMGLQASVQVSGNQVMVGSRDAPAEPFDFCVMAIHADDACEALTFSDAVASLGAQLKGILRSVSYTRSYAVCHTASSAMPENKNIWRTYNIPVRSGGDSTFPYRIDYVVNLHQNDPANPPYNSAALPQFFVSLVDDLNRIPRHDMLDRVQGEHKLSAELLAALPKATRRQLQGAAPHSGYRHQLESDMTALGNKAWTAFKHNVLNAQCIRAQQAMKTFNEQVGQRLAQGQAPQVPLLFGGGWTLGAGLQEQCLQQASAVSNWLLPG
jgi:hypothetical protein